MKPFRLVILLIFVCIIAAASFALYFEYKEPYDWSYWDGYDGDD